MDFRSFGSLSFNDHWIRLAGLRQISRLLSKQLSVKGTVTHRTLEVLQHLRVRFVAARGLLNQQCTGQTDSGDVYLIVSQRMDASM